MAAQIELAPDDHGWHDAGLFALDLSVMADTDLSRGLLLHLQEQSAKNAALAEQSQHELAQTLAHQRQMDTKRVDAELEEHAHERRLAEARQASELRKGEQTHRANVWTLRLCVAAIVLLAGVRAADLIPFGDEPAAVLATDEGE
jgi:hypothetical protein